MKKPRKILVTPLIIVFAVFLFFSFLEAENSEKSEKQKEKNKNWLRPFFETLGTNALISWYNSYTYWRGRNRGLLKISLKSMNENLFQKGYIWDYLYKNGFQLNQLDHPFHGTLAYNIGRINGLNFWESAVFPLFNSISWEAIFENALLNERPSTNDTIVTSIGGTLLGEVLFKLADLLIDEKSVGAERAIRESLALVINPIFGINRLITGEAFKREGSKQQQHYYNLKVPIAFFEKNPAIELKLEYQDGLIKKRIDAYDYFIFNLKTKITKHGLKTERLLTSGWLAGKRQRGNNYELLFGLFGNFDYINILRNRISAIGIGPGLFGRYFNRGLFLKTSAGLSVIFGGATSSFVLRYGEEEFRKRKEYHNFGSEKDPYYLGPGTLSKLQIEFGKENVGSFILNLRHYWINSVFGANTTEKITRLDFGVNINIFEWSQIGIEYETYLKKGTYRSYSSLFSKTSSLRILYSFNF